MVELLIYDYLREALPVPIYMETPQDVPAEYVLIEKTGGGERNHIRNAVIAVQSISSISLYRAATLNENVVRAMAAINIPEISHCSLNSDYNFTDTSTKQYRYQAVFDIVYY